MLPWQENYKREHKGIGEGKALEVKSRPLDSFEFDPRNCLPADDPVARRAQSSHFESE